MRRLVPLSLAALLLLSGCTGAFGPGASPTTDEPTSRATTQELDPAEADLPPGVDESGVTNVSTLVTAHNETLREKGFVLNGTFVRDPPSTGERVQTFDTVVAPGGERFRTRVVTEFYANNESDEKPAQRFEREFWGDSSGVYDHVVTDRGGTATERRKEVPVQLSLTRAPQIESYLELGEYRVEKVVARDGHTFTTLVATGAGERYDENDTFDARFVIDERGVVHEAVVDTEVDGDPGSWTDHAEYRVVKLGGSPERPAWVANVTQSEQSTTATG